jgi:F-type H+-transporting ATPase subunit b
MRSAPWCRLFALAALSALVLNAQTFAAKGEEAAKSDPKPALFAKDGDKYRPATEEELKKAAPASAGHDGHGEKKGGLDFTGWKRWDLGIYTLVVFGLLIFIVAKFAWPNIREGLAKRESNIVSALTDAKRDRAEADAKLADARKQLAEAAAQAKAILDEARKDADALKVAEREVGVKEAQAERDRAKRDLGIERDAVLKDVYAQAIDLASLMASKAIRQQMSLDKQSALVNESIDELKANASRA